MPGGSRAAEQKAGSDERPPSGETGKVFIKLDGDKDETGRSSQRLTLSPADRGGEAEHTAAGVGIDYDAELSGQQEEDEAVESVPIPTEYREIIKRMHEKQ
jgi:hypothetical protein